MKQSINIPSNLAIISEQHLSANIVAHDYLPILSTPYEKKSVSTNQNPQKTLLKLAVFASQLVRKYGTLPESCTFLIIGNTHTFGTQYRLAIHYRMDKANAINYANAVVYGCEIWDNISQQQLQNSNSNFNHAILNCA